MKAIFRVMIVLAVSGTLRADDLLDSVLKAPPAPPPAQISPPAQSVSKPVPLSSAVKIANPAPSAPKTVPPTAKPPMVAAPKAEAEVGGAPSPVQLGRRHVDQGGGPRVPTRKSIRKSGHPDSTAKVRKPGGVMACCVGCCFGRRAALDYNEGKRISPREWAGLIPFVNIIACIENASEAFDGVSRSQLHEEAPAYY